MKMPIPTQPKGLQPLSRRTLLKGAIYGASLSALGGLTLAQEDDLTVKSGYLPITDATPLLTAHARGEYQKLGLEAQEPLRFRSWADLVEAFLSRQLNLVHALMPIAVWLRYAQDLPVKVVSWMHTNGSAFTVAPHIKRAADLSGQKVAVPFWYSVHNVALQHLLRQGGLEPTLGTPKEGEVGLVILPPPEMTVALSNQSIAGFIVADPFNAQAEALGAGRILRFTGDIWHQHACCVTLMHEDDLTRRPAWAAATVQALTAAQHWTRNNREEAVALLSNYLPQDPTVIGEVLLDKHRKGRIHHPDWEPNPWIDFQPYPFPSYTERLVRFLQETRVKGDVSFLSGLNPASVHADLVDETHVLAAMAKLGGPQAFGQKGLIRQEMIEGDA